MSKKVTYEFGKPFKGKSGKEYFLDDIKAGRAAYIDMKSREILACQSLDSYPVFAEKMHSALNESRIADATILLHDYNKGMELVSSMQEPYMMYCAAILNTEGEDNSKVSEPKFEEKVADWADIPRDFFLRTCLATIPGCVQSFKLIAASSEMARKEIIEALHNSSLTVGSYGKHSST